MELHASLSMKATTAIVQVTTLGEHAEKIITNARILLWLKNSVSTVARAKTKLLVIPARAQQNTMAVNANAPLTIVPMI